MAGRGARKTGGFLAAALDGPPRLKNPHKFRPEIIFRLPDLLRPFLPAAWSEACLRPSFGVSKSSGGGKIRAARRTGSRIWTVILCLVSYLVL